MAINRVDYPANLTAQSDFSAHGDLIETRFIDQSYTPIRIDYDNDNVLQGAVFQIGGVVYHADSDTAITGTASDYVRITPSGATASAAYVASLTGVTWSSQYAGYYDGSSNLFVFDEVKAIISGAIAGANTKLGQLYESMANQDLRSTASPTFYAVTTTQDAIIGQSLAVGSSGAFAGTISVTGDATVGGSLRVNDVGARTDTSTNFTTLGQTALIPKGTYYVSVSAASGNIMVIQVRESGGNWLTMTESNDSISSGMLIFSDGVNVRARLNSGSSGNVTWVRIY